MPRFNPNKWKPTDDSSPGLRAALDPGVVALLWKIRYSDLRFGCPCGCGEFPLGDKATFCMGHDARLRGVLIRAHLMGVKIEYYRDLTGSNNSGPMTAMDIAEAYGWGHYLDAAVLRREGKNREVLRRAIGSDRLIKVGKWSFTGQVAAVYRTNNVDMYEVEYVDKAGESRRKRVPAAETEEVS